MDDAKHLMRKKHIDHFYIECIEYFKSKSGTHVGRTVGVRHKKIEFLQLFHKVVVCPPCPGRVGNLCMGFCGGRKTSVTIENSRVMDENLRSKDEKSRSRVENKNTLLPTYNTKFRPNLKGT